MKHLQFLVKADSRKLLPWGSPVSWTCPFHISCGFAPLSRRPNLSCVTIVSCNPTNNSNSRTKRSWGYYPSLRWCYSLLRRRAVFVQHVASFTDKWGFCVSQLIGRTSAIYITVTQIWSLGFLARGSKSRTWLPDPWMDRTITEIWRTCCWSVVAGSSSMTSIHCMLRLPILYRRSIPGCLRLVRNLVIQLSRLLIIRMNSRRRLPWGWRKLSCVSSMNTWSHFDILRSTARWLRSLYSSCSWLVKNFVGYVFSKSPVYRKASCRHGSLSSFLGNISDRSMLAGLANGLFWIFERHHIQCVLHVWHV